MIPVSIIIPFYNSEKYIGETIESFLKQTFIDFEIIAVNDESTDAGAQVLKSFKSDKIRILNMRKSGAAAARNLGLIGARGQYVIFFDSDDWAKQSFVEKIYNKAVSLDCDMVFCASREFNQKKLKFMKPILTHSLELLDEKYEQTALLFNEINNFWLLDLVEPWCKIYRREFLIKNNIKFPPISRGEDTVFYYKSLLKAHKISFIKEELVYHRRYSENSLSNTSNSGWQDYFRAFSLCDKLIDKYEDFETIKDEYVKHKLSALNYFYKKTLFINRIKYFIELKKEYKKINSDPRFKPQKPPSFFLF